MSNFAKNVPISPDKIFGEGIESQEVRLFSDFSGLGLILLYEFLVLLTFWGVLERVGEPGWKGLISVFNIFILLKKVGRPTWWILLFFVPVINVILGLLLSRDVAAALDRTAGIVLGLLFLSSVFASALVVFG